MVRVDIVNKQACDQDYVLQLYDYKEIKPLVIIGSHTVIDPRAMMVKSFNASVTLLAVTAARCTLNLAVWTKALRFLS